MIDSGLGRIRTGDLGYTKTTLYPLSYQPFEGRDRANDLGLRFSAYGVELGPQVHCSRRIRQPLAVARVALQGSRETAEKGLDCPKASGRRAQVQASESDTSRCA